MDKIDRLAKRIAEMHKENRNPPSTAPKVGTVVSVQPLKIRYGEDIILESRHLIIADHVMNGYKRELDLTDIQITTLSSEGGTIDFHLTSNPPSQEYTITNLSVPLSSASKITATLTYNDQLKVNDKVIITPDSDLKTWYVIDKVWQGGGNQ